MINGQVGTILSEFKTNLNQRTSKNKVKTFAKTFRKDVANSECGPIFLWIGFAGGSNGLRTFACSQARKSPTALLNL